MHSGSLFVKLTENIPSMGLLLLVGPPLPLPGLTTVTEDNHQPIRPFPRWLLVGFVLMGIAAFSGLGAMLYQAILMVSSGRGLETYRTFWLVEFNWIGFLRRCCPCARRRSCLASAGACAMAFP
jgi:hypothetical protein